MISDKWKVFGRYNQFRTFTQPRRLYRWLPSVSRRWLETPFSQLLGRCRLHAQSHHGAEFPQRAITRFSIRSACPRQRLREADLEKYWPNNAWYKPYLADLPDIYYPGITRNARASATTLGRTGYWSQEPDSWNIESKMSKNIGRNYIKVGGDFRQENVNAARPRPMSFAFGPRRQPTPTSLPIRLCSGDGWATLLLGALEGNSTISSIPIQRPRENYFSLYFHDDLKLNSEPDS